MQMIFIPVKQENYFLRIYCWIPVREGWLSRWSFLKKEAENTKEKCKHGNGIEKKEVDYHGKIAGDKGTGGIHGKGCEQFTEGLNEVSGYGGKAVPLSVLGYTSDPCPASGCNRLCVTGSMESEDGSMGKSWGERNRPDR